MKRDDFMNVYVTALMECVNEPGVDILYDDDTAELRIIKNGKETYYAKSRENEYDTKAKLLLHYIKQEIENEIIKSLKFAEWCSLNHILVQDGWLRKPDFAKDPNNAPVFTTEDLYTIWSSQEKLRGQVEIYEDMYKFMEKLKKQDENTKLD